MKRPKKIAIVGVPMDLGAGRRGVDMGPSAIRIAKLQSRLAALGKPGKPGAPATGAGFFFGPARPSRGLQYS